MPGLPQAPQGDGGAGLIALEEDGGAAGGLDERAWARPLILCIYFGKSKLLTLNFGFHYDLRVAIREDYSTSLSCEEWEGLRAVARAARVGARASRGVANWSGRRGAIEVASCDPLSRLSGICLRVWGVGRVLPFCNGKNV